MALITWYATDRRQTTALTAEEKRLLRQLEHDRAVDDRQELRKFLDQVADKYEDLHNAYTNLLVSLGNRSGTMDDETARKLDSMARTAHAGVTEGMIVTMRMGRRLALRFPRDHGLIAALQQALAELKAGLDAFDRSAQDPARRANVMQGHAQRVLDAFRDFGDAARTVFE